MRIGLCRMIGVEVFTGSLWVLTDPGCWMWVGHGYSKCGICCDVGNEVCIVKCQW